MTPRSMSAIAYIRVFMSPRDKDSLFLTLISDWCYSASFSDS